MRAKTDVKNFVYCPNKTITYIQILIGATSNIKIKKSKWMVRHQTFTKKNKLSCEYFRLILI